MLLAQEHCTGSLRSVRREECQVLNDKNVGNFFKYGLHPQHNYWNVSQAQPLLSFPESNKSLLRK
jgi:hypothetical protein